MDSKEFYRVLWESYLPEDAHIRATNRLYLSITLFPSFTNKVVHRYHSRDELINCIIASTCLPLVFLRDIPRTRYGLAIDAGFTNDQPCINRDTVTVSVLNQQADIRPSSPYGVLDLLRIPSLTEAFTEARKAERDAAASSVWNQSPVPWHKYERNVKGRSLQKSSSSSSSKNKEKSKDQNKEQNKDQNKDNEKKKRLSHSNIDENGDVDVDHITVKGDLEYLSSSIDSSSKNIQMEEKEETKSFEKTENLDNIENLVPIPSM